MVAEFQDHVIGQQARLLGRRTGLHHRDLQLPFSPMIPKLGVAAAVDSDARVRLAEFLTGGRVHFGAEKFERRQTAARFFQQREIAVRSSPRQHTQALQAGNMFQKLHTGRAAMPIRFQNDLNAVRVADIEAPITTLPPKRRISARIRP